ncbi:ArsR/SmtB family transcription factor [Legionella sp. CNM-1927-20]|uniref:ArsR/SmtB family transcription factor n=1 Tax=Legionella sp. CNM-1927-20 TaxID=3422221 RepID=UPI00403A9950
MNLEEHIAKVASLIGDRTRSAILIALMEGKAFTAGELALRANISAQTASNHLKKLLEAELITLIKTSTRYRYFRLSSPFIAQSLEALSLLPNPNNQDLPHRKYIDYKICFARTCYDHLAGILGVKITKALQAKTFIKAIDDKFVVTKQGERFFKNLGIDCKKLRELKRQFAKPCLDWTEREYHLRGSLGHAFLDYLLNNRLLIRSANRSRVLILTEKGRQWLKNYLSIE